MYCVKLALKLALILWSICSNFNEAVDISRTEELGIEENGEQSQQELLWQGPREGLLYPAQQPPPPRTEEVDRGDSAAHQSKFSQLSPLLSLCFS